MAKKKDKTFVKLFRSTLGSSLFNVKPFDDWRAFEYMILKAQIEPKDFVLANGEVIHLERGQHFESKANLAEKFGWSVKKLKGWEKRMKRLNMVLAEGLAKGTTYTVVNYTFYQGEGLAKGPAQGLSQGLSQGPRNKNNKEYKRNARACEGESPRSADDRKVIPMPEDIRKAVDMIAKEV